jgi:electron transfer flavoprotein alpha subunit
VNAFPLLAVALSTGLLAGVVALVRRGLATNRAWAGAIADHVEATGQHPSVAEWRAGRLRAPQPTPEPLPSGPATVTVTVVQSPRAELTGGAR